jgi:hypothetical protein
LRDESRAFGLRAIVLLVLGFALRFWASGLARITGDESHYWYVSRKLATLSQFPVYGPAITGSEANLPGALYYYLMAVPQVFGASPRFGAVAVIIGHLWCAWLLYLLLARARGERAALFGLALAMFTPWELLYSDRIWGSCVVPILGSAAIYGAVRAKESAAWLAAVIVLNLLLPQLHLSAPVLWFACGTIVLLHRPQRSSKKAIAIALGIVFIAYLPMLIAEIGSAFHNTRMIFAKAGGKEPWSKSVWIPLQMFGYAVLYASSEISYHFGRGYWGGYDDLSRYGSLAGWRQWFDREGVILALGTIASIALAALAWIRGAIELAKNAKKRELEQVVFLGLLAGLMGGVLLLLPARKTYFPHYANVLMPMLLWPAALALDSLSRTRWRIPVYALFAVSLISMLANSVRYYRDVDGLNGLDPTLDMVAAALDEGPLEVQFEHFDNRFAWSLLAKEVYDRELALERGVPKRWRVKNGRRHEGDVPANGRVFGPVLVLTEARPQHRPRGLVYRATESWRTIEAKGKRTCIATTGSECRYGDQPWQHLKPESFEMGGRTEKILYFHPIAGESVHARMTLPITAKRGVIRYGLNDPAHASVNRDPVALTLRQGDRVLVEAETRDRRGVETRTFTLTSTGPIDLEIRTGDDGARVFGFDVDVFE